MPRPSSPWWWAAHQRWAVTVGNRRHVAPKEIGEHDLKASETWHRELMASEYPDRKEPEAPRTSAGRVRKEVLLDPETLLKLRDLLSVLQQETKTKLDTGHVLDAVVAEAHTVRCGGKRTPKKPRRQA